MAEGYKTYTPASVGVFLSPSHFSVGGVDFHHVNVHAHKYNTLGVPDSGTSKLNFASSVNYLRKK